MPFLFPGLLVLTALAGVPIIIHLLNRRRFKPVPWAAMRFLRDALREEARRIQYKDLILMALRALVCILLALALARPITRLLSGQATSGHGVVLIVDASASMSLSTGTGTLMDAAKREALSILREMPANTLIALVDAARPATVVVPRTRDLREVEKAIEELAATDAGTDLAGAVRHAANLLREMGGVSGADVFVFSDAQASAWRADAEALRKATRGFVPGVKCFVVPVSALETRNLAVTALRIDPPVVAARQPFSADVEVLNGGPEREENVLVELSIDGARAASASIRTLEAGDTARVRMLAESLTPGHGIVEAVVGQGRGRFGADDARRSVVRVVQGLQVLLVDGEPGALFGQGESDYLDAVLAPVMDGDSPPPYVVTKIAAQALTPKAFADKDIVFLCNVPALSPENAAQLQALVARGVGLIVFLGRNVPPGAYAPYVTAAANGAAPLLPAAVGKPFPPDPPGDNSAKPAPLYLSAARLEHAWMSFFRSKENLPLLRVPVQRACALSLATNSAAHVVAWYENGAAAIVESQFGRGRVVMCGTSADADWSALFQEPLGPILVSRMVSAILSDSGAVRSACVGERVQLPLPPEERRLNIRLTTPDGKVSTAQPELAGDQPLLVHNGSGKAGVYRYQIDAVPPREERFVLNLPPDESDIRPLPADALTKLFPAGEFNWIQDRGDGTAGNALRKSRVGHELWWPVLLAAFLMLIGEITFARLITTEAPSSDDLPPQAQLARHRVSVAASVTRGRETP